MNSEFNIPDADIDNGKVMGGFSYLFEPIGFIVAILSSKQNKFVMFHAQQALLVMIIWVILNILWVASVIPLLGWVIDIFIIIGDIVLIVLWVIGIINGFSGNVKPIPLIGKLAYKLGLLKPEDLTNGTENIEMIN